MIKFILTSKKLKSVHLWTNKGSTWGTIKHQLTRAQLDPKITKCSASQPCHYTHINTHTHTQRRGKNRNVRK